MTHDTPTPEQEHHLNLRQLKGDDYEAIRDIMRIVFPDTIDPWSREEFETLLKKFPEGQIGIEDNGKLIAGSFSIIVKYSKWGDRHTYDQITDKGAFSTHTSKGDTLYGVDIFVHPDYRGMRLGRRLYDARKDICYHMNLRAIIAGGRIPNYSKHSDEMTPQEYVKEVKARELFDPILTFQLSNGFHVRKIMRNYLREDQESGAYATLLEWLNIYYEEETKESHLLRYRSSVRVGTVQWLMRSFTSVEDLMGQVEYFVDAVSDYKSDVILFPEFFNGPLMELHNDKPASDAVRELAKHTDHIRDEMVKLALSYNINIIAGSMPEYEDDRLRNVSFLCRRDGTWDKQYKIHVTPDENSVWGMVGGDKIQAFDTDFGKIGILICYDCEFPELGRLLAEEDVDILFVPFWTDTKNGYQRVRHCAQARAIENECYVVLSGSTGNLPKVVNMDMQYAQAAVLTPSDFAFPHDCIAAEATPNTETTLIADLDLEKLIDLHNHGSVKNLRDRRKDLYKVVRK